MSPGILGTYWLLASLAVACAWSLTATLVKRAAHHAGARCYCGTCQR